MSPDQEKIARWLAAQSPSLGEAYTVVLHLWADANFAEVLNILSTNRTFVGWEEEAGGKAFEDFELSLGKCKVEITLIWGGNSEFRKTFELPLTIA